MAFLWGQKILDNLGKCYFVMLLEETFNAFYSILNFSSFIKKLFNITIKGHFFAMLVRKG